MKWKILLGIAVVAAVVVGAYILAWWASADDEWPRAGSGLHIETLKGGE